MAEGLKLAPLLTEIKVDLESFKADMANAEAIGTGEAEKISDNISRTARAGERLTKVGSTLTKAVSAPLIGVGVAATKMAVDYENSFAKVSTLLDENIVDLSKYKSDIIDASSDTKIAVDEFSESVYSSISAGVDQRKAIGFTRDAMKLAKGGFTDGAKAVDVLTTAINGYNLSADDSAKISDLLITTQNLGKTTVDELASSMGAVIPVAAAANFGMEELSASYAQLTKNGIATAESGTYLKSMLSELNKNGSITDKTLRTLTGKGFAELKSEGIATSDILKMLSDAAEQDGKSLKDMFGSVEAGSAALVLYKGAGEEYNEMLDSMGASAGATQAAFDKMDATPAERMAGALNRLKNSGLKIGEAMLPTLEKGIDLLDKVADKFAGLTDEQRENIVKWGAVAVAAGPVLSIFGGVLSTGTKLIPIITGISGAMGASTVASGVGLTATLGSAAAAALPFAAGLTLIGTVGYSVYKALTSDVIPQVDLFADEMKMTADETTGALETTSVAISEETKKQLQSFMDLSQGAQQETLNMYAGVTEVTSTSIGEISGKVEQMASDIISASENQKTQVIGEFQEMFANTSAITVEEQTQILSTVEQKYQERIEKTNSLKAELLSIYDEIKNNSGQSTKDQQERIDAIYEEMRTLAVQSMSQSEAEQSVILNRLSSSNQRITAEMVGNTIKELNQQRDDSIAAAQESRDEQVRQAELLRSELGESFSETADKIIEEANRQYDEVVAKAEGIRDDGVQKIIDANQDMKNKVDTNTGEVLSIWGKLKNWWDSWHPEPKTVTVTTNQVTTTSGRGSKHFNGLDYVPYDGYQAELHKGERVLTREENAAYSSGKQPIKITIPLQLEGREIARASAEYLGEQLAWEGI